MALFQRQELRQAQSLVMTPQLQQAIRLLQLSSVELTAYVEEQVAQNPLLERAEPGDSERGESAAGPDRPEGPAEGPAGGADTVLRDGVIAAAELDADHADLWDGDAPVGAGALPWGSGGGSGGSGGFEDGGPDLEQTLSRGPSLREHLEQQASLEFPDPSDRMIAAHLTDMLDDAGYFVGDLDEAAAQLGCGAERVAAVFRRLQQFEPTGLFARSLAECLALQLRERNRLDPAMQALLDHLDLLARRDFAALERICGVDRADLLDMLAEIRRLDPKPALAFGGEPAPTVVPDVLMRPHPDGGWQVELNPDALPRVLIDARYHARVQRGASCKAERDYIAEQYSAASWLVKSLHQRATTVLKVAGEIVRQQDGFFALGVAHLRPLTLRDIATAIGMHESTVSRVTTSKYIATPRGLFEMKYFFTAAIQSASGGEAHSAEAVRFRIKALIDQEPPTEVLSDDRIVDLLRSSGIDIARRTVAKYREAMRIPSSVQRRKEKMAAGRPAPRTA